MINTSHSAHSPCIFLLAPQLAAACCLYELYTGSPLFPGVDNNDMLWHHQAVKGRFPHRMIRTHLRQVEAFGFECHFEPDMRFRRSVLDPVSRTPTVKLTDVTRPTEDLGAKLLAKRSADDDKRSVLALRDLLEAMLTLDPAKRISVRDAICHPFIRGPGSGHPNRSSAGGVGGSGHSGGAGSLSRGAAVAASSAATGLGHAAGGGKAARHGT
jgi:serine/threonine protein kinase